MFLKRGANEVKPLGDFVVGLRLVVWEILFANESVDGLLEPWERCESLLDVMLRDLLVHETRGVRLQVSDNLLMWSEEQIHFLEVILYLLRQHVRQHPREMARGHVVALSAHNAEPQAEVLWKISNGGARRECVQGAKVGHFDLIGATFVSHEAYAPEFGAV